MSTASEVQISSLAQALHTQLSFEDDREQF